MIPIEIILE